METHRPAGFGPFVNEMAEGQGSPGSASASALTGEEVLSRLAVAVVIAWRRAPLRILPALLCQNGVKAST